MARSVTANRLSEVNADTDYVSVSGETYHTAATRQPSTTTSRKTGAQSDNK
jgi:hypothetical protein